MQKPPQPDAQPSDSRDYLSNRPVSFLEAIRKAPSVLTKHLCSEAFRSGFFSKIHCSDRFLVLKVIGILGATFGTAVMLVAALEPQPTHKPAATSNKSHPRPIVQSTPSETLKLSQNKDNQKLSKSETVILPYNNRQSSQPHPELTRSLTATDNLLQLPSRPKITYLFFPSVPSVSSVVHKKNRYSLSGNREGTKLPATKLTNLQTSNRPQHQNTQPPQNYLLWQQVSLGMPAWDALKPASEQQAQTTSSQIAVNLQASSELTLLPEIPLNPSQTPQNHQPLPVAEIISQVQMPSEQQAEQVIETTPKPNQQESAPKGQTVKLTLSDVVILALENNRPLKNAYLERIAQRQDLAVAEAKFLPTFTPSVSVAIAQFGSDTLTANGGLNVGTTVSVKVPTGGELSFRLAANSQTSNTNVSTLDPNSDIFGSNLQLSFRQPLLRGAGINLNRASIDIAQLNEQVNILALKSTLINTITNVIYAYRNLLQAQERVKIEQRSLELAQQILEVNRALIEAGRLAPVDIVQSETAVANRQVSLLDARNNLEATKLTLLDILDLDQNIDIESGETLTAQPITFDSNNLRQLAFENRPDYLSAQLNQKTAQLALLLAEDEQSWDLNLITSFNNTLDSTSDLRAGLVLSREFGDLTQEQRVVRSQINLLQSQNTLQDLNDSIKIQVTDGIRDVNLRYSQVELARKATVLSEQQLDIEREKQRLGRGGGIFEVVRLQNELADARNAELNATIAYLNALTKLDQTLGITLDTWQVTVESK